MNKPFTCPRCGMTSHNPNDSHYAYCANCATFLENMFPPSLDPDHFARVLHEVETAHVMASVRSGRRAHANVKSWDLMEERSKELRRHQARAILLAHARFLFQTEKPIPGGTG